jgi:hypothetical protein
MAPTSLGPPTPNLKDLGRGIYLYIANHPFIISSNVHHPITKEIIHVNKFRLWDGQVLENGLVCSIYADYPKEAALFEPWELGENGHDKATFFFKVKYSYNEVILGNQETNKKYTEVPEWAQYGLGQNLLTSNTKKNVILEINPGIEIIQEYLQLTKYIIDDIRHKKDFPLPISSIEMLSQSVKTKRWEEGDTIYFQEGQALLRIDAYISRAWRDRTNPLYTSQTNINTTIN